MSKVFIYEDTCKGCGLCTTVCPKKILEINKEKLNSKGYHPAGCIDEDACISCASCAKICPDVAIEVEK